jgi:hypothetical protein
MQIILQTMNRLQINVVVNSTIVCEVEQKINETEQEMVFYVYFNACTAFHIVCGIS